MAAAAPYTPYAQLTLPELAKRLDPNGDLATIVESLNQENEILYDAPWMEANGIWTHKTVRRISLPTGTVRMLNAGVGSEASKTQPIIEGIFMLESYNEVDCAIVDTAPDQKSARNQEAIATIEGMGQTFANYLIYGNIITTPERFQGLAPRMPSLAATQNVIGQGGTGSDLTSIFIVQWGPQRVFCIYPRGHVTAGVKHEDLGKVTKDDGSALMHEVYRDHFMVYAGLVVKDDRCIGRLANIETSGASNTFDEDNLIRILNRMPASGKGASLYVNDTIQSQMEIALKDKTNVNYTPARGEGLAGEPVVYFRQCAVRKCDQISVTEAALS